MHRTLVLLAATVLSAVSSVAAESGGPDTAPAPAVVPGAPGAPGRPASGFDPSMIILLVAAFAFMWLVVIRPQKKEEKKRQSLIASMKPGHKVITIGGVHGEVTAVGETTVDVRVGHGDNGVVMTFNKGAISTNVTAAADAPAK